MRVRIKICGISDRETASIAIAAGADALGLVFFAPSSRHVDFEQAQAICHRIPAFISLVGVMVNPEVEYVREAIRRLPLTHIQFHGEESEDFCSSFELPYIKGIRVTESADLLRTERRYTNACAMLLDTHVRNSYGGTGRCFDWRRADYGGESPVILAGGLTAENVSEGIRMASPYGVDVSSGVETEGKKDHEKIRAFCENVIKSRGK